MKGAYLLTKKLFLDLGHGGKDGGAQGNGLSEKLLTLTIGHGIFNKLLAYEDVQVKMSRIDDRYLTLGERTDLANSWGADLFLSIHINSAESDQANGFETFVFNGNISAETIAFQNIMHEEIRKQIQPIRDRGKKRANLAVLRQSNMPALLTENLFISNGADAGKLKDPNFINKVILGHVIGIEKFLGLKRKSTEEPTMEKLYRVQLGAFSKKDNAEALVKEAKEKGFLDAFIVE